MNQLEEISEYEIDRGKPLPSLFHCLAQTNLLLYLVKHYEKKYEILPEITQNITEILTTPDIGIYEKFEIDWTNEEISFDKIPLLNIEILTINQSLSSVENRIRKYFEVGVKSCWIVFPSIKLIVIYFQDGRNKVFDENETLKDEILNIEIPLKEIFK